MHVYVIRHGIADAHAASDFDRRLTAEGRERFAASVRGLERLGVRLDQVLHSPLLRAVETAELLEPLLDGPLTVLDALADAPDERLFHALERAPEHVALVGHEPWLSQFVAWLACGERRFGPAFHLSKGAVVRLEGRPHPGDASLTGFWKSGLLRKLGRGA
jgi:phosphohistidine phosphatase